MSLSDAPVTLHAHVLSTVFEISRWFISCDGSSKAALLCCCSLLVHGRHTLMEKTMNVGVP